MKLRWTRGKKHSETSKDSLKESEYKEHDKITLIKVEACVYEMVIKKLKTYRLVLFYLIYVILIVKFSESK